MCKRQLNTYQIIGNIAIIFTRKGEPILIDLDDLSLASEYNWYLNKGYGYTHDPVLKKTISIHRLLMNPPDFLEVDHINHLPWDNRRSNLRISTTAQNQYNSKLRIDNTSGYKGVSYNKKREKWLVNIRVHKKKKYIGAFKTLEEAVKASQLAQLTYHGEYTPVQQQLPFGSQ